MLVHWSSTLLTLPSTSIPVSSAFACALPPPAPIIVRLQMIPPPRLPISAALMPGSSFSPPDHLSLPNVMSPISSQPLETSSASLIGGASVTSVPSALLTGLRYGVRAGGDGPGAEVDDAGRAGREALDRAGHADRLLLGERRPEVLGVGGLRTGGAHDRLERLQPAVLELVEQRVPRVDPRVLPRRAGGRAHEHLALELLDQLGEAGRALVAGEDRDDLALVARPQRLLLEQRGDRRDVAVDPGVVDHPGDGAVARGALELQHLGVDGIARRRGLGWRFSGRFRARYGDRPDHLAGHDAPAPGASASRASSPRT